MLLKIATSSHFTARLIPYSLFFRIFALFIVLSLGSFWALHYLNLTPAMLGGVIFIDSVCLFALGAFVLKRLISLWHERQRGMLGSKIHLQFILLFTTIIIIPTFFLSFFCIVFFKVGVESWFGDPVKHALVRAQNIAGSYLKEHQESIRIDTNTLINFLKPQMSTLVQDKENLNNILTGIAQEYNISEILIFNNKGEIIARSHFTFALIFETTLINFLERGLKRLDKGEVVVLKDKGYMRSLSSLDSMTHTYLFIGKMVPQDVLKQTQETQEALGEFQKLSQESSNMLFFFLLFFSFVVCLLMFCAIWVAIEISQNIVRPIQELIKGAQDVSEGNLDVTLPPPHLHNEFDVLVCSFNQMTHQLRRQNRDLVVSQRKSAWADVARKIAHEIKNPLTPIQLSAERLKKRFLREISSDPQTFEMCIDTIIRQVHSIGTLVQEFSSFARMPEPQMVLCDIKALCEKTLFLQKQAFPMIKFDLEFSKKEITWSLDQNQVERALTNLVQNAVNAVREEVSLDPKIPHIRLKVEENKNCLVILIEDNGPGFPKKNRERLLEPYVTTREKGTGLGLAIVSRIVSDHDGAMELDDSSLGGALVRFSFKRKYNGT